MSELQVNRGRSSGPDGMRSREGRSSPGLGSFGLSPLALSPFAMIREFTNEMDRLTAGGRSMEGWAPAIDVQQCGGSLVVSAELPGLKRDEVKVALTDDTLIIEGERKYEHKDDHEGYHRRERSYGRFYRGISLPEGAKTEQIKAELKDGVLRVSIPVPESKKKPREVPIQEVAKNPM
jgi:HSP20 family protein